jgi:hypothetical protein
MNEQNDTPSMLTNKFATATPEQIDTLWSLLRYQNLGILRKIKCMSSLFNLDSNEVIKEFPMDENQRVFDRKSRHLIHNELIKYS